MINKGIKLILIILMVVIHLTLGCNKCYAESTLDVVDNPYYWGKLSPDMKSTEFNEIINKIISTIRIIGIIVSVATLAIIGIKFMLGSVEEKAQYKQTLLPWLIGAVMVFAISVLPMLIHEIVNDLF